MKYPQFEDFREILPKDTNGDPDWIRMQQMMIGAFGVNAFNKLDASERKLLHKLVMDLG